MTNKTKFEQLKSKRQIQYKKYKKCYCSILKENIHFTSDGFYHLRYEVSGRQRTINEQMYKLGLLPLAVPVIKNAKKIDSHRREKALIDRKKKTAKG